MILLFLLDVVPSLTDVGLRGLKHSRVRLHFWKHSESAAGDADWVEYDLDY